jgi:Protein of unknown function (DUF2975)
MNRIKSVSKFFRIIFQIFLVCAPIALAISWYHAPDSVVMLQGIVHMDSIPQNYTKQILHTLSAGEKFTGFLVSLVPCAIYLFMLYSLIKLFQVYESGVIFSVEIVKRIRNIGYALLAGQAVDPFYQAVMGVVLTLNNPKGHRLASVTLDQTNIGILLTALLVILISWIMMEGCKLNEEQQLTI